LQLQAAAGGAGESWGGALVDGDPLTVFAHKIMDGKKIASEVGVHTHTHTHTQTHTHALTHTHTVHPPTPAPNPTPPTVHTHTHTHRCVPRSKTGRKTLPRSLVLNLV
jgi:hypothetical protein